MRIQKRMNRRTKHKRSYNWEKASRGQTNGFGTVRKHCEMLRIRLKSIRRKENTEELCWPWRVEAAMRPWEEVWQWSLASDWLDQRQTDAGNASIIYDAEFVPGTSLRWPTRGRGCWGQCEAVRGRPLLIKKFWRKTNHLSIHLHQERRRHFPPVRGD